MIKLTKKEHEEGKRRLARWMRSPVATKEEFKRLREKKGYTQEEIAQLFGVTKRAVKNWETGRTKKLYLIVACMHILPAKKGRRQHGVR